MKLCLKTDAIEFGFAPFLLNKLTCSQQTNFNGASVLENLCVALSKRTCSSNHASA